MIGFKKYLVTGIIFFFLNSMLIANEKISISGIVGCHSNIGSIDGTDETQTDFNLLDQYSGFGVGLSVSNDFFEFDLFCFPSNLYDGSLTLYNDGVVSNTEMAYHQGKTIEKDQSGKNEGDGWLEEYNGQQNSKSKYFYVCTRFGYLLSSKFGFIEPLKYDAIFLNFGKNSKGFSAGIVPSLFYEYTLFDYDESIIPSGEQEYYSENARKYQGHEYQTLGIETLFLLNYAFDSVYFGIGLGFLIPRYQFGEILYDKENNDYDQLKFVSAKELTFWLGDNGVEYFWQLLLSQCNVAKYNFSDEDDAFFRMTKYSLELKAGIRF